MGRLVLLIVLAAAIGGSVVTLSTRGALSETSRVHAEGQEDVLAREIAEAGQSVALRGMLGEGGFTDPTASLGQIQDYDGGQFEIEYVEGTTNQEATIRVTGTYGGAVHTVESTYALDPMDAPGALWLDVPFATASASNQTEISGSAEDHGVQFDPRRHEDLDLQGLLPMNDLKSNLRQAAQRAGSGLRIPEASAWVGEEGLLGDLNVENAQALFAQALSRMDDGDQTITGDHTVASAVQWGAASDGTKITHVDGDLTVTGRVTGHGALLVGGALRVPAGGRLDWDGLVVVYGTDDVLPIELEGRVNINGMMAVAHEAFAPGGHLDVSVYRDAGGMSPDRPEGDRSQQVSPWSSNRSYYPFHQHTHAFDITPAATPRGDHVFFLENGSASKHRNEVQFKDLLDGLGSTEVYLAFGNPENHGHSRFNLHVTGDDGTKGPISGTIQGGFGAFASPESPTRSRPFPANRLHNLDLDVLSLRSLSKAFDTEGGCGEWPICIGRAWDREGALSLQVVRASDDARLYEASFYWHMRTDEEAAHAAEEAAWRKKIQDGEAFGTHLTLGNHVTLTFDIGEINELSDKLQFDGDELLLVTSAASHLTPAEARATVAAAVEENGGNDGDPDPDGNGIVTVCHKAGNSWKTKQVGIIPLPAHLLHGDYLGPCIGGGRGGSGGSGGSGG